MVCVCQNLKLSTGNITASADVIDRVVSELFSTLADDNHDWQWGDAVFHIQLTRAELSSKATVWFPTFFGRVYKLLSKTLAHSEILSLPLEEGGQVLVDIISRTSAFCFAAVWWLLCCPSIFGLAVHCLSYSSPSCKTKLFIWIVCIKCTTARSVIAFTLLQ